MSEGLSNKMLIELINLLPQFALYVSHVIQERFPLFRDMDMSCVLGSPDYVQCFEGVSFRLRIPATIS